MCDRNNIWSVICNSRRFDHDSRMARECVMWCEMCVVMCDVWFLVWDTSDVVRCDVSDVSDVSDVWCEMCLTWWDVMCDVSDVSDVWCEMWVMWWDVMCDVSDVSDVWCEMCLTWWDVMCDVSNVVRCDVSDVWCQMWCEMWVMWWDVMWYGVVLELRNLEVSQVNFLWQWYEKCEKGSLMCLQTCHTHGQKHGGMLFPCAFLLGAAKAMDDLLIPSFSIAWSQRFWNKIVAFQCEGCRYDWKFS